MIRPLPKDDYNKDEDRVSFHKLIDHLENIDIDELTKELEEYGIKFEKRNEDE